ncbi:MAG: hypothetical protein H6R16_3626 [Proteobacteria bacterium]|nr:hypothetical protein [Pseudomonadota bacterium]
MNAPKYTPPLDPNLAIKVDALDDDAQEFYQERAGIRQFDGRLSRPEAEAAAWKDTLRYLEQRNSAGNQP